MSEDILRRAVSGLREEWSDDGPNPMGTAWHSERDFHLAVADWLDDLTGPRLAAPADRERALAVARAYLGATGSAPDRAEAHRAFVRHTEQSALFTHLQAAVARAREARRDEGGA